MKKITVLTLCTLLLTRGIPAARESSPDRVSFSCDAAWDTLRILPTRTPWSWLCGGTQCIVTDIDLEEAGPGWASWQANLPSWKWTSLLRRVCLKPREIVT